jgi:ferredoxin
MNSLKFNISNCVRAASKFSECSKCVDICPVDTIQIVNNVPAFTPSECISCGGCVGICPSESFSLTNFSPIEFFFNFLEKEKKALACKKDTDCCLSVLNVEHLISMTLSSQTTITIDIESCECGGQSDKLKDQLRKNVEEVNYILSSFCDKEILIKSVDIKESVQEDAEVSSRRDVLSLKGMMKSKKEFDEAVEADELKEFGLEISDIEKLKQKNIPDKRKLLYSVLKRLDKKDSYNIIDADEVSFVSQKYIDDSCTNCQICHRICPSGALSSNGKFSVINFDAMMCIRCNLCHDVCEPNSIHTQKGFEIQEFFEPRQRTLAVFDIKRCNECGNYFTYTGGPVECKRCQIEENEAYSLHGYQ